MPNDSTLNFRDFFIIKDNKKVTFTSYLTTNGLTGSSWFDYKKQPTRIFLGLPTSNEIEKFLNFNRYTIKNPFKLFSNSDIYDYDVCRYIDAGIDYNLINVMLGYEFI